MLPAAQPPLVDCDLRPRGAATGSHLVLDPATREGLPGVWMLDKPLVATPDAGARDPLRRRRATTRSSTQLSDSRGKNLEVTLSRPQNTIPPTHRAAGLPCSALVVPGRFTPYPYWRVPSSRTNSRPPRALRCRENDIAGPVGGHCSQSAGSYPGRSRITQTRAVLRRTGWPVALESLDSAAWLQHADDAPEQASCQCLSPERLRGRRDGSGFAGRVRVRASSRKPPSRPGSAAERE
jgi:hypothetical protein